MSDGELMVQERVSELNGEKLKGARRFRTEGERWEALKGRDARADGIFVYAVRTTGVYCRPGCAARLALRENVVFFDTCAEAEAAGFRACKRCRPKESFCDARSREAIARACEVMAAADEMPSLEVLAKAGGFSRFHFQRLFKKWVGVSPRQYGMALREGRARKDLQQRGSVTEAIYSAGYNASSRFYERATGMLGMKPSEYRAGGRGLKIRYAVVKSALGWVLVAGTERGICSVQFGESRKALEGELKRSFSKAEVVLGDEVFQKWVAAVVAEIGGDTAAERVPLDVRGTVFQHRVWQALREIPKGKTTTYTAVAAGLGKPGAVRAVARACATNPVAVVVPCHRVVRADGELAGYRWGLERKRKLLKRETEG